MLQPVYAAPGICKVNSDYASGRPFGYQQGMVAQGRYVDGLNVEFVAGFPQKIAGWTKAFTVPVGIPRALKTWRANSGSPMLAVATETHLYAFDGTNLTDVTPLRTISSGNLTNPFTTTLNSTTVNVADTASQLRNGDWVYLSAASSVGGLTISGWYSVSSSVPGTGYNITSSVAATGSVSGGGGTTAFQYPRINLTNPFTTTSGSNVVTVAHTAHGAVTGNYVVFSGASNVGGVAISGEYQLTVVNANSYTITAATTASTGTTGGGTVSVTYLISTAQLVTSGGRTYGSNGYGTGVYGLQPSQSTTQSNGWTLDRYGSQLLAAPIGGTIYVVDTIYGGRGYPLQNAPTVNAMFVTPERFVVGLGVNGNPLQIAWADQNNYTVWTSLPTNTANSGRTLQGGNYFVGGIPVRNGVSLIFTDRCVFQMAYTGGLLIYDTPLVADNAGLLSPWAVTEFGGTAYWMSDADFWTWNGTVQALPSDDIRDFVFSNLNKIYAYKCNAGTNREKRQVRFFYADRLAGEIDRMLIYQVDQQCWSLGNVQRTGWTDASLFQVPFGCDASGTIYYEESGVDANGAPLEANLTFAPTDVSNGMLNIDIFGFLPDFERQAGSLNLTINSRYYPQDPNQASGPYTISPNDGSPRIDLRLDGKMVGFELDSNTLGGDFRLGVQRVDIQPSGARR